MYASAMTVLVVSFIVVGSFLWPGSEKSINTSQVFTGNVTETPKPVSDRPIDNDAILAATKGDSADTTLNKKKKFDFNDKVQFVKDQR